MDSRFLESLIRVIDTGSIAQAARIQHLTAAAISQRIRTLEIELGTELLTRSGHCAKPTDACARMLPRARQIVKDVGILIDGLSPGKYSSSLRLGVISSQWTTTFPIELDALRDFFPETRISLSLNTSRLLYSALFKGELDAVIIEAPDFPLPRNISTHLLRTEPLVLISKDESKQHPHEILLKNNYIEYLPDPLVMSVAAKYLKSEGLSLKSIYDTGSLESIKALVSDGAGVSLVPRWPCLENPCSEISVVEVACGQFSREIVLLTSRENSNEEIYDKLLEILRNR